MSAARSAPSRAGCRGGGRGLGARGVAPAAAIPAAEVGTPCKAAPSPWIEATVRAAVDFASRGSHRIAPIGATTAARLALGVLRETGFARLKVGLAAT